MAEFLEQLENAELVLVGLGEEFDGQFGEGKCPEYDVLKERLAEADRLDLIPLAQELYRGEQESKIKEALNRLSGLLEKKNYFIVSTSLNPALGSTKWREGRIVRPCGDLLRIQCPAGCEGELKELDDKQLKELKDQWFELPDEHKTGAELDKLVSKHLGKCVNCGSSMIFNTIYADKYNEAGYLNDWQTYMTWLQGTIHKSVMILELGVSMKYPSVIRFPFEKVAFYNGKSVFYRVNEKLYHMTEELHDKGISIKENASDWLLQL